MAARKKGYENGLGKAAKLEWTEEADASFIRMIKEKLPTQKLHQNWAMAYQKMMYETGGIEN